MPCADKSGLALNNGEGGTIRCKTGISCPMIASCNPKSVGHSLARCSQITTCICRSKPPFFEEIRCVKQHQSYTKTCVPVPASHKCHLGQLSTQLHRYLHVAPHRRHLLVPCSILPCHALSPACTCLMPAACCFRLLVHPHHHHLLALAAAPHAAAKQPSLGRGPGQDGLCARHLLEKCWAL